MKEEIAHSIRITVRYDRSIGVRGTSSVFGRPWIFTASFRKSIVKNTE
jgi:hypothetical protein